MNAIDEFEAFARMMEVDGQDARDDRKDLRHHGGAAVKGRLRYGLIHPDIRAAARGKVITLDTMKAFAEHPSQEAPARGLRGAHERRRLSAGLHGCDSALKSRGGAGQR